MTDVIIVGDGPAGLSAALFLGKNGMDVTVFGENKTDMHRAMLYNYLGIPKMTGSEFQRVAREQVKEFGASIRNLQVTDVETTEGGFAVSTIDGNRHESRYLIIAEGKTVKLVTNLSLAQTDEGVAVDRDGRTSIERLYVVGRGTRKRRSQAIVSAGQGATAALDILSTEAGRYIVDYDVVSD